MYAAQTEVFGDDINKYQEKIKIIPTTIYLQDKTNVKVIIFALFAFVAVASAGVVLPSAYSLGLASPYAALPLTYAAAPLAVAPAIQSGYVAATRGSVHTAPLPEGPFAFSHHINTAPAPGTL
ncbi:hypothetical protein NQ317_009064 [Molorchus minor]|uniref:Cuticle protein n=1 Tax=Molorchus minor TaxID=1323400 RepID=A0ABQ9JFW1_9CUCU|nr:hypothetical protein NQ317_009064 [Molorchus minor]